MNQKENQLLNEQLERRRRKLEALNAPDLSQAARRMIIERFYELPTNVDALTVDLYHDLLEKYHEQRMRLAQTKDIIDEKDQHINKLKVVIKRQSKVYKLVKMLFYKLHKETKGDGHIQPLWADFKREHSIHN